MYDTILLPTDGSEGTDETLRHGLEMADRYGAALHALYVVDRRPYLAADDETQDDVLASLQSEGENAVEAVRERAGERGVEVSTEVREGIPYKEILAYIDENGVDAVVMGTHGRTGRDRLVHLGSVTERVLKNATVPVFVVNIGERGDRKG